MKLPVELQYLYDLLGYRLSRYFNAEQEAHLPEVPNLNAWQLPMAGFINDLQLSYDEAIILLIALAPHIQPDIFDQAVGNRLKDPGDFPVIGGVRGKNFRGLLPTAETALFILGSDSLLRRTEIMKVFSADHFFAAKRILWLEDVPAGEPMTSGRIIVSSDYMESFITGRISRPHFNMNFPARLIHTDLEWNDLVLNADVMQQIRELEAWVTHQVQLMNDWGMKARLKPGYRVLFHGPPGTGKTFTASLIGKYTGRDVYKIDLSMVVSKYIGETEKNLETLFAKAEDKQWILFFDEADALFGKRTNVRDAHDKYANQEVSYLLQRVEDFDGLVILASNMKTNIDEAFTRRFNSIIHFPYPSEPERLQIWENAFPKKISIQDGADAFSSIKRYELTGGNIINVVQYACLKTLEKGRSEICVEDLLNGIKREMNKEGKPFVNKGG
jgi:AAA+ superfamily predicted ATPase